MLHLRPHHLLCLLFYEGKGYDEAFVQNMDRLIAHLHHHQMAQVLLTDGEDYICSCCPQRMENGQCVSNQKVEMLDQRVIDTFHLKIGQYYDYHHLTHQLSKLLNEDNFKKICSECEWYKQGICGKGIINTKDSSR